MSTKLPDALSLIQAVAGRARFHIVEANAAAA
jgi:hypothetical protein